MNTDNYIEFDNQLDRVEIYYKFKDLIKNNELLKHDLYNEFINTDKVPSRKLYTRQFVSDEELNKAFADSHSNDPELRIKSRNIESILNEKMREFDELQAKGDINKDFYDHDISATTSIKTLVAIDKKLTLLKKCTNSQHLTNYVEDGKMFAKNIFLLIKKLTNPLWIHEISTLLLEDDANIHIDITLWANHSAIDDTPYKLLKGHFDSQLDELLSKYTHSSAFESGEIQEEIATQNLRVEGGWSDLNNQTLGTKNYDSDHVQSKDSSKKIKVASSEKEIQFSSEQITNILLVDSLIGTEQAADFVKKLQRLYLNAKPEQYPYMLYALYDLGMIVDPAISNKTNLHNRLTAIFGYIGTRQNLTSHINRLNAPNQEESAEIQRHKVKIIKSK